MRARLVKDHAEKGDCERNRRFLCGVLINRSTLPITSLFELFRFAKLWYPTRLRRGRCQIRADFCVESRRLGSVIGSYCAARRTPESPEHLRDIGGGWMRLQCVCSETRCQPAAGPSQNFSGPFLIPLGLAEGFAIENLTHER